MLFGGKLTDQGVSGNEPKHVLKVSAKVEPAGGDSTTDDEADGSGAYFPSQDRKKKSTSKNTLGLVTNPILFCLLFQDQG